MIRIIINKNNIAIIETETDFLLNHICMCVCAHIHLYTYCNVGALCNEQTLLFPASLLTLQQPILLLLARTPAFTHVLLAASTHDPPQPRARTPISQSPLYLLQAT